MSTLTKAIESLSAALPTVEVERVADAAYVNYDFDTALVVEPSEREGFYLVVGMHWDRTHGVDAEHYFGEYRLRAMVRKVKRFVAEEERKARELDALLASMPEESSW